MVALSFTTPRQRSRLVLAVSYYTSLSAASRRVSEQSCSLLTTTLQYQARGLGYPRRMSELAFQDCLASLYIETYLASELRLSNHFNNFTISSKLALRKGRATGFLLFLNFPVYFKSHLESSGTTCEWRPKYSSPPNYLVTRYLASMQAGGL